MVKLTREQRVALKAVYDRPHEFRSQYAGWKCRQTYRKFRAGVYPGSGCIMIHWCGMWLGIELDGYTHS